MVIIKHKSVVKSILYFINTKKYVSIVNVAVFVSDLSKKLNKSYQDTANIIFTVQNATTNN